MLSRTSPMASSWGYGGSAQTWKCSTPAVTRWRGGSCIGAITWRMPRKLALERETHPALRCCITSPSRAPTERPSLSHTTHPIHRSAVGSWNSRPLSYTPAGKYSRRSPTLLSLRNTTACHCNHYSCCPSCPPHRMQTLAASGATSVHVSSAPATWWRHQPSTAPPPKSHSKSSIDLHVKVLTLCTFSTATLANNHNT